MVNPPGPLTPTPIHPSPPKDRTGWLEEPCLSRWPPQHPSVPPAARALSRLAPLRCAKDAAILGNWAPSAKTSGGSVSGELWKPRCHLEFRIPRGCKLRHQLLSSFWELWAFVFAEINPNHSPPFVVWLHWCHNSLVIASNDVWLVELFIFDLHQMSRLLSQRSSRRD